MMGWGWNLMETAEGVAIEGTPLENRFPICIQMLESYRHEPTPIAMQRTKLDIMTAGTPLRCCQ